MWGAEQLLASRRGGQRHFSTTGWTAPLRLLGKPSRAVAAGLLLLPTPLSPGSSYRFIPAERWSPRQSYHTGLRTRGCVGPRTVLRASGIKRATSGKSRCLAPKAAPPGGAGGGGEEGGELLAKRQLRPCSCLLVLLEFQWRHCGPSGQVQAGKLNCSLWL